MDTGKQTNNNKKQQLKNILSTVELNTTMFYVLVTGIQRGIHTPINCLSEESKALEISSIAVESHLRNFT